MGAVAVAGRAVNDEVKNTPAPETQSSSLLSWILSLILCVLVSLIGGYYFWLKYH